ncbi:Octaprenyl-diphosphate synthase (Octaprenyl pyrophosphate synthetase) (OPP synthetase) [Candidatus Glomeribacter gigasporarum BEG34]|uniref:Octaprenyl-diphosphate synthase (Octaprenyl pyrophosphate synthetase) (OPP synthetase) n=1 Tax=Candidatus Glomeribacter gigasporarum BEG34 TaxID=1070319 RepID=G2J9E3_9BURK|nr:polyprenyl synthetase family protein [Candidatus Glomeribacter gigasporarum]CCD29390.1 Octaprenyl-diphosphate synthase (Octaprenyl pyrophosphate synthetase) (OPP synthetase) [Candidatus Glomeribacter gigasporarum BEG34]
MHNSYGFLTPIADELAQLNRVIWQHLDSEVELIRTIAQYLIAAGGKRLRPALLLLVSAALGAQRQERHLLAAVIEFIHTATLLHDDVVDASNLRRGKKTANALFGNAASVLTGDFLYSRAFQMMVSVGRARVMHILADATHTIAEGEVLQLLNARQTEMDEARYMQIIHYKTAKLFEAAAQLGALISDANTALENAAAEFGRRIGTAFQLMDDWLDYAGDVQSMGKNAGDDLHEGKMTLPLIYLLKHGGSAQRAQVCAAVEKGDRRHFEDISDALRASGALDYTRECAQREAQHAASALRAFPHSIYTQSLLELCAYSTTRKF